MKPQRHCEERRDEAIHNGELLDCFNLRFRNDVKNNSQFSIFNSQLINKQINK